MIGHIFNKDLFRKPEKYEEGPLRDRKSWPGRLADSDEKKAEFLRDVIALANTARMLGQPAYLLLGLQNKYNFYRDKPEGLDNVLPLYTLAGDPEINAWEQMQDDIFLPIQEYIEPSLVPNFRHGVVRKKQVAYLVIPHTGTPNAFRMRKTFKAGKKTNKQYQSWIRFGPNKLELEPLEINHEDYSTTYCFTQVPHPLPPVWKRYFTNLLDDDRIVRSKNLTAYQPLQISDGSSIEKYVNRFLDSNKRLLVISGGPGSGKTTFIRRFVGLLAEYGNAAMIEAIKTESYNLPSGWIPVFFPLRLREIATDDDLAKQLINCVHSTEPLWTERPKKPELLFDHRDLHWVVCLDGLDELWDEQARIHLLSAIQVFIETYQRVKVIVTTRHHCSDFDWESLHGIKVTIEYFNDDAINKYISTIIGGEGNKDIIKYLKSEPDLWRIASVPLHLEAFVPQIRPEAEPDKTDDSELTVELEDEKIITPDIVKTDEVNQTIDVVDTSPALEDMIAESLQLGLGGDEEIDISLDVFPSSGEYQDFTAMNPQSDFNQEAGNLNDECCITQVQDSQLTINSQQDNRITIGQVCKEVYTYIWGREIDRRPMDKNRLIRWRKGLGELAVHFDGNAIDFEENDVLEFLKEGIAIDWITYLGILERNPEDSWMHFFTETTKLYWAAEYLKPYLREESKYPKARVAISLCTDEFQGKLRQMLLDISMQDPRVKTIFEGG